MKNNRIHNFPQLLDHQPQHQDHQHQDHQQDHQLQGHQLPDNPPQVAIVHKVEEWKKLILSIETL